MSWQKVKLGSILTESKVISENPDTNKRIKVRLKVLGVEKRGIENEVEGATKQFVRKAGQFIYGKQNFHKGAFGIVPKELDGFESSSDLPAFDVDKSCLPEFLFYFFKQGNYYLELSKIASGVATQRINTSQLFDLEISLPEIEIQKILLKNIKILENNGGEISSELTHQLDLIKQLRQAFLREAMQGRFEFPQQPLTEALEGNGFETGQQLLAKIKAEKAKLIAEKKLKKEKELAPISEDEIPFEIPENWAWCRLGEICNTITKGSSPNWQGVQYVDSPEKGILFITSKNVDSFKIDLTKATYVEEKFNEIEPRSILKKGDLLTNIVGASIGRTALYELDELANINQAVCILRIEHNLINKQFLLNLMNSNFVIELMFKMQFAPGRANLSMGNVANFTIPLPPLHEQKQIVAKLEELMAYCDGLEQSIKESQGFNEMLLQQVLREALQGEAIAV
jgi:type I restriction enzyme S subunit